MISICPRCDKAFFVLEFKGIEMDFCHQCRGLWLDAGELELLLERTGADAHDPLLKFQQQESRRAKGRRLLCPRCHRRLVEIEVKGGTSPAIILNRCKRNHGLWFDQSELQQLLAMFPSASGASKTVAYLKDLLGKR